MKYEITYTLPIDDTTITFECEGQKKMIEELNNRMFNGYEVLRYETIKNYMSRPDRYKLNYLRNVKITKFRKNV